MDKFLIFDTETEDLNLFSTRPWQLSYLLCEGVQIKQKHDYLLEVENFKISKDAARITNFKKEIYEAKKVPAKPEIERFMRYYNHPDVWIVGHNIINFDLYTVRNMCRENGVPHDYNKVLPRYIDTNCLAKAIKLDLMPPKDPEEFMIWQIKLSNFFQKGLKTNLAQMASEYDIEFDRDRLHDALYDIELNWKVFLKMKMDLKLFHEVA